MLAVGPLLRRFSQGQIQGDAHFDTIPKPLVHATLREAGLDKNRLNAKLPAELVLRLVTGLAPLRDLCIPAVLNQIAAFSGTPASWRGKVPHSTSITQARDRLGFEVVRSLFKRFASYLAERWLRAENRWEDLVTVAIDGTMFNAPDSPENVGEFGRPGGRNGTGGYPKFRMLALVSTASHFVLGCVHGPCKGKGTGEPTLAKLLLPLLQLGWLLLGDKGFCSYSLLADLLARERFFFIRKTQGKTGVTPKRVQTLKAGRDWWVDYLPTSRRGVPPLRLRLVRIELPKKRGKGPRWVEFLTNLPPERYPYKLLLKLYLKRWEVEFAFREIKSDVLRKFPVFRSRKPQRVLQELYGLLLAYNAIRLRMAQAAQIAGVEPRELSFSRAAGVMFLAFFSGLPAEAVLKLTAEELIPQRKAPRSYPRVTKRPVSKFPANKARAKPT